MQGNNYQQTQIIFLTDVNIKNKDDRCIAVDNLTTSIALSCFRVLNYFSNSFDAVVDSKSKRKSCVRWGYKFFDSSKHVSKIENYVLRDFKTKYFEEFENELERRFEAVLESRKTSITENKTNKSKSADCLQRSLTEVIYDFQWENSDLFSPIKGKHRKKSNTKQTRNLVVLLATCPHNKDDLRSFCGKKVMDDEVFLDGIMPESLLVKFQSSKISLFWIDLYSVMNSSNCTSDINSLQLVDRSLQHLNGRLIPVELVFQLGNAFSTQISAFGTTNSGESKDSDSEVTPSTVFPTKCCFDFYFNLKKPLEPSAQVFQESSLSGSYMFGTLRDTRKNVDICCLYLLPSIETPSLCKKKLSHSQKSAVISLPTHQSSSNTGVYNLEIFGNSQSDSPHVNVTFSVYGTLRKTLWKEHCANHNSVSKSRFICQGFSLTTKKHDVDSDKGVRSEVFGKLLMEIQKQDLVMILRLKQSDSDVVIPCLAVLEPFTSLSGIISVLSLGISLSVEKQLYAAETVQASDSSEAEENLQIPTSQAIKKLCSFKKPKETSVVAGCSDLRNKKQCGSFSAHVLEKNHLPGSSTMLGSLFTKLNDRLKDLQFLNNEEKRMLHKLQKHYRKENQPINFSRVDSDEKNTSLDKNETSVLDSSHTDDATSTKLTKRGSQSGLSRSQFLVSLGKEAAKEKAKIEETEDYDNKNDAKKTEKFVPGLINIDFNSENDLKAYIIKEYNKGQEGDSDLSHIVQAIYLLSEHYMKTAEKDNPLESAQEIIQTTLIKSNAGLRDKYQSNNIDVDRKIQEYKLQILLRLELEATKSNVLDQSVQECVVEEIVTMLRTLSFTKDAAFVPEYLKNVLVENYIHTIPNTLVMIYNDLMLPLPDELESFLNSDDDMDNTPASNRSQMQGSVSSQPASNHSDILTSRSSHNLRNRKSLHHPSLTDVGHKRQIVISNLTSKATTKSQKKKEKTVKKQKEKRKEEVKVRRNIFNIGEKSKLERRQSVAVMESTRRTPKKKSLKSPWKSPRHKSPWKSPRARDRRKSPWKSPRSGKSPRVPKSPGRNSVLDTPAHKQFSHVLRERVCKQLNENLGVNTAVNVIEESPVKPQTVVSKDSPSESTRVKALFRRAFYSSGPVNRSRNLNKSLQLADRIAGRHTRFSFETSFNASLSQLDTTVDDSSPSKNASSFLLSQFISSPSPTNRTPKKGNNPLSVPNTPVFESPSCNTRSKTPLKYITPKALFNNSPFIDGKMMKVIEEKTPVKSIQKAMVTESPSANTRSKFISPTRQSVRMALSFKSPSSKKITFNSPKVKKELVVDGVYNCGNVTPIKQSSTTFRTPQKLHPKSPVMTASLKVRQSSLGFLDEIPSTETSNSATDMTSPSSMNLNGKKKQSDVSRTPSPSNPSKKIKTPESLDKWPRKKKRWNTELSPHAAAVKTTSINSKKRNSSDSDDEVTFKLIDEGKNVDVLFSEPAFVSPKFKQRLSQSSVCFKGQSMESLNNSSPIKRRKSIKRSLLLSPENISNVSSPSKKVRTMKSLDSPVRISACLPLSSSRTFNVTNSITSLQEEDYFSASNDEVFLSSQESGMEIEESSQDENSADRRLLGDKRMESPVKSMTHPKSGSPVFSPKRHKTKHKALFSVDNSGLNSDSSAVGDPVVCFSSPKSRKNMPLQQALLRNSPLRHSPKNKQSPCSLSPNEKESPSKSRKFSPNVSTKSLMQLMQSPLLDSAKKVGFQSSQSETRKKHSKRSLNMT